MKLFMKWLISILLLLFLGVTILAAWGARENFNAFERAKTEVLGTVRCKRVNDDTWSGSAGITCHFVFPAHGIGIAQPQSCSEPWTQVKVKGRLTDEKSGQFENFEWTGDFMDNRHRFEFMLRSRPRRRSAILDIQISGLGKQYPREEFDLSVVNFLCGCEKSEGIVLSIIASVGGSITLILAFMTKRVSAKSNHSEAWKS